jgi:hypothetical protein
VIAFETAKLAAAIVSANEDLDQNDEKFDAGDPNWQIINVGEARDKGIMPISFEATR